MESLRKLVCLLFISSAIILIITEAAPAENESKVNNYKFLGLNKSNVNKF